MRGVMRVAMLGPITWRTPPRAYGPWEQVVSLLTEGLVERGVDVTLFATLDSVTTASLDGVCPRPYGEDPRLEGRVWEALHVAHCLARAGDFDLVHNHLDWLPLAMSRLCPVPMLTTVHGFSSSRILPAYRAARSAFVSISDADRAPGLPYVGTVHHGIDVARFPFRAEPADHLVAFGRIHPDKGTADAIDIARRAGMRLVICGPVHDERYWRERVRPLVDGTTVVYRGNVGPAERADILGGAVALLHPVGFAEPFGLSVVEAMACGTPVIAYPRGAIPELVDIGVTGYLASDTESASALVGRAAALDRARIRTVAVRRFSTENMCEAYLRAYRKVTASGGGVRPGSRQPVAAKE